MNTNKNKALIALLTSTTVVEAAEQAGLHRSTLYGYLADTEFQDTLKSVQDAIVKATTAALVGLSGDSLQVMLDIIRHEGEMTTGGLRVWSLKLRAANIWLTQMAKNIELADLVERIEALEGALQ